MTCMTRRWFKTIIMAVLFTALPLFAFAAGTTQPNTLGGLYLELDGVQAGPLLSSEGGIPAGDVAQSKTLPNSTASLKNITNIRYADITVTFVGGMTKQLYQWMQDTLSGNVVYKNGAIIYTDHTGAEFKRLSFKNALISEIGLPALNATDKSALFFTLKIAPESTIPEKGKGGKITKPNVIQEKMLGANFKLTIAGLDTSRVNKIEALTTKISITSDQTGNSRIRTIRPAKMEIPDLVIEMDESRAQSTFEWFNDFLVNGNNGQDKEKSGTLEYLSPTMKTLFTVKLNNLGIFKLETGKSVVNDERISKIKASMYSESLQINSSGQ